ncbi:hypothetical protein SAMN05421810_107177 [Amycolatopsis arida]|uniref:CDP-Glycerol:Poly(Glycerophosphate) glycerophosphotransferase n=1 Tax=Amycolatopsis arida TaxID=587909 RepID=A0A1I5YI44_9PSEU|nr:hypothetical protein [Amycolatopsis arida]TDX90531.1 hypothetical protein CLV69_107177 [Amycolatopsis arida]SFQ43869.1 hypothetical protein SAMN05421810_107177 [Amycolatopsis arida]
MTGWIRGPFGLGAASRVTLAGCRTVLVVVPTMTAGTRLLDLVPLLEADHRVQVVFTVPHTGDTWHGVEDYVRRQGGLVLPWHQATRHAFDLVLAASHRHLADLHGPILLLPHGAGSLMSRRLSRKAGAATTPTTGLDRELLTFRGRVLPAALALTSDDELPALRELCPEAEPVAVVAGDICLDRMLASLPLRRRYRDALGVAEGERLTVVSSTWSTESTFGQRPELYRRALVESGGRVAAVLHPNIWTVHGTRQVRAWLADCLRAGLLLIPPEEGWRGAMVAADWVLGDHGSTTAYAAAIGRPITLATFPRDDIRPGSLADLVREAAPALDTGRPLAAQLEVALTRQEHLRETVAAALSSRPGGAAAVLRATMYRLLNLPEPACGLPTAVVPLPVPLEADDA